MKLLSRLWLSALSASRYPVTFAGMAMHSERRWFEYSGGFIKAFLRPLATGAPGAGNSLPAAHFPTKTM